MSLYFPMQWETWSLLRLILIIFYWIGPSIFISHIAWSSLIKPCLVLSFHPGLNWSRNRKEAQSTENWLATKWKLWAMENKQKKVPEQWVWKHLWEVIILPSFVKRKGQTQHGHLKIFNSLSWFKEEAPNQPGRQQNGPICRKCEQWISALWVQMEGMQKHACCFMLPQNPRQHMNRP